MCMLEKILDIEQLDKTFNFISIWIDFKEAKDPSYLL